ncbi:hypothetical protein WA158_007589 [Blastocystis sp. Blastoise]
MAAVLKATVRLKIPAGQAKPSAQIGQALGPLGVNMRDFCKEVNAKTTQYIPGIVVPVELSAFSDNSFKFIVKTPPVSYFLFRCAGISLGAHKPGHENLGKVNLKQVYEIATIKKTDPSLQNLSLESIVSQVIASAKTMGIEVYNNKGQETPKK